MTQVQTLAAAITSAIKAGNSAFTAGLTATLTAAALLSACGGGSDGLPCGGASTLNLDLTYEVNGVLVDPTRLVVLTRGAAVTAVPRVIGLPAACAGAVHLTATARSAVPASLVFDAASGAFTGPTSLANLSVELKVQVDGYTSTVQRTVNFVM